MGHKYDQPLRPSRLLFVVIVIGALFHVGEFGAHAEEASDVDSAREAFARGKEFFDAGQFELARDAFEESMAAVAHYRTVFNIALCSEKLGEYEHAIQMYTQYVEWPDENVTGRDDVQNKIAELELLVPPKDVEPVVAPAAEPADRAPEGDGLNYTLLGGVTLGAGLAATVTGVILLGAAVATDNEIETITDYDPSKHDELADRGR